MRQLLMVSQAMKKTAGEPLEMVIDLGDLGYHPDPNAWEGTTARADELMAFGIGRKNFSIEGTRLLVRIPDRKREKVLTAFKAFKQITTPGSYYGATHSWLA